MKTLAEVRRRLTPGTTVQITNHLRPQASGPRKVHKNQTKDIGWELPDGQISWLKWPKASEIEIENEDTVTFYIEGRPLVTLVFEHEEPACFLIMGCLCAAHARGADVRAACDARE